MEPYKLLGAGKEAMTFDEAYTVIHNEVAKYRGYTKLEEALVFLGSLKTEEERLRGVLQALKEEEKKDVADLEKQRLHLQRELVGFRDQAHREMQDLEAATREAEIVHQGKLRDMDVVVAQKQEVYAEHDKLLRELRQNYEFLLLKHNDVAKEVSKMETKKAAVIKTLKGVIDGHNS